VIDPDTVKAGDVVYAGNTRGTIGSVRKYRDTKRVTVAFNGGNAATFEAKLVWAGYYNWRECNREFNPRYLEDTQEHEMRVESGKLECALDGLSNRARDRELTIEQVRALAAAIKPFEEGT
jgi:hypothetical protein